MDYISPLASIPLGILLAVESHLLGKWFYKRYQCQNARYIQAIAAVILHGSAAWIVVRGIALSLN